KKSVGLYGAARGLQRLCKHVKVADVIGQQQYQRGVHSVALLCAQVAVRVDELFVEVVGYGEIRVGIKDVHAVASKAEPLARSRASRTCAASGWRQRAAMCWSGRIR